jgi:ribonuclease P protein component
MLPKRNRADKKQIKQIFKEGRFLNTPNLTFKYIKRESHPSIALGDEINNLNDAQISFIAPKNIAKLAVKRNLLRRQGYFVLKKYISQFPSFVIGVFVYKKIPNSILEIENEIKTIINKIN